MTTPTDPVASPDPASGAPTPGADQSAQTAAIASTDQTSQVTQLAVQLQQPDLAFDPATVRKATITASNPTNSPPDVSLQLSGDTTTTVDNVRYIDSYSPVVGDTVLVVKQGTDIFVLGQMNDTGTGSANGWQTPTLSTGFTTNGNSNGALQYRLVIDNGERKVQWRGSVAHTGTNLPIISGANVLSTNYRPADTRTISTSRDPAGGSNVCQIVFGTDGTVTLAGATTFGDVNGGTTGGASAGGSTGTATSGSHTHSVPSDHTHSHGGAVGVTSFVATTSDAASGATHSHSFTGSSHTHTFTPTGAVSDPTWVGFNRIEYFL